MILFLTTSDSRVQLHTFCDASEAAYGACIYARCEDKQGPVRISLLASKSRLAPLKRITLPRLELSAAVMGAHLYERVRQAMRLESVEAYFWSDSTVTLHWLSSSPNTWRTYVDNRVAVVQACTHQHHWMHIAGCSNPADLVSRGVAAAEFVRSTLWSRGPEWLSLPSSEWPSATSTVEDGTDLEIRQVSASVTVAQVFHPWFELYSSYTRLVRVIGYCLRFVHNVKGKCRALREVSEPATSSTISPHFMEAAKTALCRLAQQDVFQTKLQLEVLTGLTDDQIATQSTLQFMPDEKIKALGIAWEPEADVLYFESRICTDTRYPTMRLIFSGISRMFDPIGLIAPIIVRAKLLMQELWVQKPGWDDPVSDNI